MPDQHQGTPPSQPTPQAVAANPTAPPPPKPNPNQVSNAPPASQMQGTPGQAVAAQGAAERKNQPDGGQRPQAPRAQAEREKAAERQKLEAKLHSQMEMEGDNKNPGKAQAAAVQLAEMRQQDEAPGGSVAVAASGMYVNPEGKFVDKDGSPSKTPVYAEGHGAAAEPDDQATSVRI